MCVCVCVCCFSNPKWWFSFWFPLRENKQKNTKQRGVYQLHKRRPDVAAVKQLEVGIECPGECDREKLNAWIAKLLTERGTDIFRTKGVLAAPHLHGFWGPFFGLVREANHFGGGAIFWATPFSDTPSAFSFSATRGLGLCAPCMP